MIDGLPPQLRPVTIKDLRRDSSRAPGGPFFGSLVQVFLPFVYGSASVLLGNDPILVREVVRAVFQSFAFRWRKLPKRTVIATWLLRSTWHAAVHERKRSSAGKALPDSAEWNYERLFKRLFRLRPVLLNAVVVRSIVGETALIAAKSLRTSPARVDKRDARGVRKLSKALRKKGATPDLPALFAAMRPDVPGEIESSILQELSQWSPKEKKSGLVRSTLIMWRWLAVRRLVRRVAVTASVTVLVLASLAGVAAWLFQQGFFMAWAMQNSGRQMAKEMPGVVQPARPWPVTAADQALVRAALPGNSAELYNLTNIWTARLSFTEDQWKSMEPSHIQPVSNLRGSDGRISLRNPKAQRNGLSGALGIDFNWSSGRLDFARVTLSNVAIRFRGNGTYVNSLFGPKQSFKVDLNRFDKEQRLGDVETLNFLNSIADNSYLHDVLGQRLFRDLGVPGPRTAYAYLSLDVPGKFANQALGLYVMVENVDAQFAESRFGSKKTPIFKPVTYDLFKDQGDDWKAYAAAYDLKTKATSQQKQRVIQFARLVTSADDAEFEQRLPEFLDIDEFAGFVAGHVLLSSYDGFLTNGQNYYMYLDPRTDKFGFISWDQDHGWGEFGYVATTEKRENASIWEPAAYNNHFLRRVMKVQVFHDAYRWKLESALANLFTVERLYAQIDSIAPLIRPAVAAENDFRLNRFDQSISTNWITGFRGGPPEGPKAPVHQMKRFIANRIRSVRDQLDGKTQGALLSRFR